MDFYLFLTIDRVRLRITKKLFWLMMNQFVSFHKKVGCTITILANELSDVFSC